MEKNVQAGIDRIRRFQTPGGGLSYWPGEGTVNLWATNYGGHFLLEARRHGYQVPDSLLADLIQFQKGQAGVWTPATSSPPLDQSYRLYLLALAGKPEIGAMNRLRELPQLDNAVRWQLAAAYQLAGQQDAAASLVGNATLNVTEPGGDDTTFGSKLRNQAIILLALSQGKDLVRAKSLADKIAVSLASPQWYSTQSVAYALLAIARFVGGDELTGSDRFSLGWGAEKQTVELSKPIWSQSLRNFPEQGGTIELRNMGERTLYVTVISTGVPPAGIETTAAEGLSLQVQFTDNDGNALDVARLPQGSDVRAVVTVANLTGKALGNLALTQIIPSGWQILNPRLAGEVLGRGIDFQDVRDDRLLTYFSLNPKEERVFETLLNASYRGRFYLPAWQVEPMYDATRFARNKGRWVEVVR